MNVLFRILLTLPRININMSEVKTLSSYANAVSLILSSITIDILSLVLLELLLVMSDLKKAVN